MNIDERIAEVLGRHQKGFFGSEYGNCAACTCDWKGAGWADHVASVLMAELGLTGECQTWARSNNFPPPADAPQVLMVRYVTAWERAE